LLVKYSEDSGEEGGTKWKGAECMPDGHGYVLDLAAVATAAVCSTQTH